MTATDDIENRPGICFACDCIRVLPEGLITGDPEQQFCSNPMSGVKAVKMDHRCVCYKPPGIDPRHKFPDDGFVYLCTDGTLHYQSERGKPRPLVLAGDVVALWELTPAPDAMFRVLLEAAALGADLKTVWLLMGRFGFDNINGVRWAGVAGIQLTAGANNHWMAHAGPAGPTGSGNNCFDAIVDMAIKAKFKQDKRSPLSLSDYIGTIIEEAKSNG